MKKRRQNTQKDEKSLSGLLPVVLNIVVVGCVSVYDFITDLPAYMGAGIRYAYYRVTRQKRSFNYLVSDSRATSVLVFTVVFVVIVVIVAAVCAA